MIQPLNATMSRGAARRLGPRRRSIYLLCIALGIGLFTGATSIPGAGAEVPADHGAVAPTDPRTDIPKVLNGKVEATVQFGDKIVVGGSFTRIELRNGDVVDRSYLFAYDINTGGFVSGFDPIVDREVGALEAADDGSGLFIAGKFNTVDGVRKRKVAKLDRSGNLIDTFTANADAKVGTLDDDGSRLYIGGSFASVNGAPRLQLAAVDIETGSVSSFRNDVTVAVGRNTGAVKTVDVSPDNTRLLVVHASARVDGKDRFGIAQIDLATDEVTDWRTDWYKEASPRCSSGAFQPRDAEYSPDGSMFVVVEKGAYRCDKTIAFPSRDGPGLEQNLWVTQAFDSVYSVGISDAAVYFGGHFCFINPLGPIPTSEASRYRYRNKPGSCESGGNEDSDGIAARYQIAALDPASGGLLDWNPGTNVQEGVFDIEVTDRGVLLGLDRDLFNNIRTGRHAFLDFGGLTPDDPPDDPTPPEDPNPPITDVCARTSVNNGVRLDWTIVEANPNKVHIRRDDRWVATLAGPVTTYTDAEGTVQSYVVRYRSNGQVHDVPCTG